MHRLALTVCLLSVCLTAFAQGVTVNFTVDTGVYDVAEPLRLWQDFLGTKDDRAGSRYWNSTEVSRYGDSSYFLMENDLQVGTDNYLRFLSYGNVHVLSITEMAGYYKIKSMLSFEYQGRRNVYQVFNVYAGREKGVLKLYNALPLNARLLWDVRTVGIVRYHYPRYHEFDVIKADTLNRFLAKLSADFEVNMDTLDYYLAPTSQEMLELRGYDYFLSEGGKEIPNGYADVVNKAVYTVGMGEFYPHEAVHVFLNGKFSQSHEWATEGLAVWLGGSRGKSLDWHLHRMSQYLTQHPEVDLDTMLDYRNMDEYTAYKYPLGGYVIRSVYETHGLEGVKRFMTTATGKKEYYQAVEKMLGVRQEQLDEHLREMLAAYAPR